MTEERRKIYQKLAGIVDYDGYFGAKAIEYPECRLHAVNSWEVDTIPSSVLSQIKLVQEALNCGATELAREMSSLCELLHSEYSCGRFFAGRSRKEFGRHLPPLIEARVVKRVARRAARGVIPIFTVPKVRKRKLRIVLDLRELNARLTDPPKFKLPSIDDIIQFVQEANYGWETDGVSWFNQFAIGESLASYCCFRVQNETYCWLRLPMGFSFAPKIAHTASLILLNSARAENGLCCIDNIYGGAKSKENAMQSLHRLRMAADRVQANVSVSTEVSQHVRILGVMTDLEKKSIALSPETVDKIQELRNILIDIQDDFRLAPSARLLWKVLGHLNWARRILDVPAMRHFKFFFWLKKQARKLGRFDNSRVWKLPLRIAPGAFTDLLALLSELIQNTPRTCAISDVSEGSYFDLWSDASDTGWGIVLGSRDDLLVKAGRFSHQCRHKIIALRELHAARRAVFWALRVTDAKHLRLFCDNQNVVSWLSGTISSNYEVACIVEDIHRALKDVSLRVVYVRSEENLADLPSRSFSDSAAKL